MWQFSIKIFLAASFILISMSSCSPPKPIYSIDNIPFIPLPSSVTTSDMVLPLNEIQSIRILGEDEQLISMAQNFKSFWKNHTQDELKISHGQMNDDNAITLKIKEDFNSHPEAYKLVINSYKISVFAKTAEGIFRGLKTLEQMVFLCKLEGKTNFLSLPGGIITDQPGYEYRGAMLDVARHFFSVADVKRYIDLKRNVLQHRA